MPLLQLAATDLNSGNAVGITRQDAIFATIPQVVIDHLTGQVVAGFRRKVTYGTGVPRDESVAKLVAASGAFPMAFNAVLFTSMAASEDFTTNCDAQASEPKTLLLSDGGLMDNLGIDLLLAGMCAVSKDADNGQQNPREIDVVFVSDASQLPDTEQKTLNAGLINEVSSRRDFITLWQ